MLKAVNTSMGLLKVAPLTQGEIKRMLAIVWGPPGRGFERLMRFVPVLHWSISKNHPDITLEQLTAGINFGDMDELFTAIMAISKIEPRTIVINQA